jgi:hypothetical protein
MGLDGLDAGNAVILSFPVQGNEALWEYGKVKEADHLPLTVSGFEFLVEKTLLDPWDESRRMMVMRRGRGEHFEQHSSPNPSLRAAVLPG